MQCPRCPIVLKRVRYEGINVYGCERCGGHLLSTEKLRAIKARREYQPADFQVELRAANDNPLGGDAQSVVKCPKCKSSMQRRKKNSGAAAFAIDYCQRCDLFWLDAGELAKLQLLFEASETGAERQRLKERLENMTPEQRDELEKRIAALPEETFVGGLLRSYLEDGAGSRLDGYYGDVLDLYFDD